MSLLVMIMPAFCVKGMSWWGLYMCILLLIKKCSSASTSLRDLFYIGCHTRDIMTCLRNGYLTDIENLTDFKTKLTIQKQVDSKDPALVNQLLAYPNGKYIIFKRFISFLGLNTILPKDTCPLCKCFFLFLRV